MLAHVADAFTVASVVTGLWAALLWWRSTHVQIEPDEVPDELRPRIMALIKAFGDTNSRVSTLNSHAAGWTAASVAFQALATLAGRLALLG